MTDFIPESLTDDQIITLLQMLFTNMNNLDKVYYDMFINTVPMDVTLERYDENGTLQTLVLPNRAKDKVQVYMGQGDPEGVLAANVGSFYFDTTSRNMYYKSNQTERNGWTLLRSAYNFQAGRDYITPTGNGSGLTSLNGSSITSGLVSQTCGGTGANGLDGIIRGNGPLIPCTVAVPGVDYMAPTAFVGMVAYFAGADAPSGWLVADGRAISRTTYANLFNAIGTVYGVGDGSTTFNIPDLRGVFIRGLDNGKGYDSGRTLGSYQASGAPNIKGGFAVTGMGNNLAGWEAFQQDGWRAGDGDGDGGINGGQFNFNASRSSTEYQDGITEIRPKNVALLACIKY